VGEYSIEQSHQKEIEDYHKYLGLKEKLDFRTEAKLKLRLISLHLLVLQQNTEGSYHAKRKNNGRILIKKYQEMAS